MFKHLDVPIYDPGFHYLKHVDDSIIYYVEKNIDLNVVNDKTDLPLIRSIDDVTTKILLNGGALVDSDVIELCIRNSDTSKLKLLKEFANID